MARTRRSTLRAVSDATLTSLLDSWERSLQANNKSAKTVRIYRYSVTRFARWLAAEQRSEAVADISKADIETFLAHVLGHGSANTTRTYAADLKVFFRWCVAEDELEHSPMARVAIPTVPEQPPDVLSDDHLRALLHACSGTDFYARRDLAIMRLLIDTGLRRSEIAGLMVADVDLKMREATVLGKWRRQRTVRYQRKCAEALDRYLRMRGRHKDASLPQLWLGLKGAFSHEGVYHMLLRRARQAGIDRRVWPHLFRHGFAHAWLSEGGSEGGLMRSAGWRSRQMLDRYGASVASERAREEASRLQLGDRL